MDRPQDRSATTAAPTVRPLCHWLRWKGMFLHGEPDPTVPSADDGFVWCVHTMNCLGPDGQVASKDECRASRDCFEGR